MEKITLPYPVGSHVFAIKKGKVKEFEYTGYHIHINSKGEIIVEFWVQISALAKEYISDRIGKTWFLSREEAELRLKDISDSN